MDRIEETIAETENDTTKVELFFDWCALSGVFEVYDTTFALESTFPFDLCVTVYQDTLALESPCEAWNLVVDTGETVCLSADQILSAEKRHNQSRLKLYPNPTDRFLTIEPMGLAGQDLSYTVRDMNGREVLSGQIEREPFRLDLGRLSAGVFVLELRSEKGVLRRRFVKSE